MRTLKMTNTTRKMTTQSHSPWHITAGATYLDLVGPDFTVTCKRYMHDEEDAVQTSNLGRVATSLNSHAALVEALEDACGFIDFLLESKTPEDLIETSGENTLERLRAALALAKGGNE
jgi:hypothetical protein